MSRRPRADPCTPRDARDVEAYWAAAAAADERAAHARGVPLESVLIDLVVRARRQVGHLWASNEWTVAREHAATEVSERVVQRLGEGVTGPATGPVLLVACAEREWHALPALVVSHTLRSWGHRVVYLGATAYAATRLELGLGSSGTSSTACSAPCSRTTRPC